MPTVPPSLTGGPKQCLSVFLFSNNSNRVLLMLTTAASNQMGAATTRPAAPQPEKVKSIHRLHLPLTAPNPLPYPSGFLFMVPHDSLVQQGDDLFHPGEGNSGLLTPRVTVNHPVCQLDMTPHIHNCFFLLASILHSTLFYLTQVHFSTSRQKQSCVTDGENCVFFQPPVWLKEGENKIVNFALLAEVSRSLINSAPPPQGSSGAPPSRCQIRNCVLVPCCWAAVAATRGCGPSLGNQFRNYGWWAAQRGEREEEEEEVSVCISAANHLRAALQEHRHKWTNNWPPHHL